MKISKEENTNRVAIFFFYDKEGVVDAYIEVLLDGLMTHLSRLIIVCNGKLNERGKEIFSRYTKEVLVRDNVGFDVWAYKYALEYIGIEYIKECDELILLNHTFFGPLYPFEEMFDKMNGLDIDFWGITAHHEIPVDPFGTIEYHYIPEHIQSYFMAIRKNMLSSDVFEMYWKHMKPIKTYEEAIGYHEAIFTKKFADNGFKWGLYVDTRLTNIYTHNPIAHCPEILIEKYRCPIIKRRNFFQKYEDVIGNSCGKSTVAAYSYIDKYLEYDVDVIWSNILRTQYLDDIVRNMHLNYILPNRFAYKLEECNRSKKIALVLCITQDRCTQEYVEYIKNIPSYLEVVVVYTQNISSKSIYNELKNISHQVVKMIHINNKSVEMFSDFIKVFHEIIDTYDLVCLVVDYGNKMNTGIKQDYISLENTLNSTCFINNVIYTFEENPRLGMLVPPSPNSGEYYSLLGWEWEDHFEQVNQLAKMLNIKVPIDKEHPPMIASESIFWLRTMAIKDFLQHADSSIEDLLKGIIIKDRIYLKVIEKLYAFVVQEGGYYTGVVMSDEYARLEITNLNYYLETLNKKLIPMCNEKTHARVLDYIGYKRMLIEKGKKLLSPKMLSKISKYAKQIRGRGRSRD